jgi:serine/threonine protein phosphatase PrpC
MGCLESKEAAKDETLLVGRTERQPRIAIAREEVKKAQKKKEEPRSNCKAPTVKSKKDDSNHLETASDRTFASSSTMTLTSDPPKLDENGRLTIEEITLRQKFSQQVNHTEVCWGEGTERMGVKLQYAYCSQRGYYPNDPKKANQDAVSITPAYAGIKDDIHFAVYDGHGASGDHCAKYAKQHLPMSIAKYIRQERSELHKERNERLKMEGKEILPFNPKLWPLLNQEQYERACVRGHLECNEKMIKDVTQVSFSGTTSISVGFHNGRLTISNVGDSRAILGVRDLKTQSLSAIPLSQDQTPWRQDERERIKEEGGRIMTIDQMEGKEEMHENFGNRILGESDDVDIQGDPPRVWLQSQNIPGTSFTRSLGDKTAKSIGVCAKPEFFSKDIEPEDEVLILASDGVFEFLTNQQVMDICESCEGNPIDACKKIVGESYEQWLTYEDRTDDISIIVISLKNNVVDEFHDD